jgi:hypothetical protein
MNLGVLYSVRDTCAYVARHTSRRRSSAIIGREAETIALRMCTMAWLSSCNRIGLVSACATYEAKCLCSNRRTAFSSRSVIASDRSFVAHKPRPSHKAGDPASGLVPNVPSYHTSAASLCMVKSAGSRRRSRPSPRASERQYARSRRDCRDSQILTQGCSRALKE